MSAKQNKLPRVATTLTRDEVAKLFGEMAAMMLWREINVSSGRVFLLTPLGCSSRDEVKVTMTLSGDELVAVVLS